MASLVAQGVQSRHFKKSYMLLLRPHPWLSSLAQLSEPSPPAYLRGSQLVVLSEDRTLKMWVLESPKVKADVK